MYTIDDIKPNKTKAIFLAKKQLSELVFDAVNLEGIHYTLSEVCALLEGITVGGHRLQDEKITLNQAAAWHALFELLETNQFILSKSIALRLHHIAAEDEALSWGKFRDGNVTIAGTDYLPPSATELDQLWETMRQQALAIESIYYRAIGVFLQMARYQFFYDVNKRMGRFMMNGMLLNAGYPVINLPAKRQQEFNELMLAFYTSGDVNPMTTFMKSCLDPRTIAIMCE